MLIINFLNNVTNINNKFIENIPKNKVKYYNISNFGINISNEQKKYIEKCTIDANDKLFNLPTLIHNKNFELHTNFWNFCVNPEGSMFNLPYTLNNVIFLPISIIHSNNLTQTLIHERIHILQRYNVDNWLNYIEKNTIWKKLDYCYCEEYLNTLIKPKIIIKNPDVSLNQFSYKNYIAFFALDINTNIVNLQWFYIDNNKKIIKFNDNLLKYEHPFEYYAYYYQDKL